jgi:hypothetical protein
MTEENILKFSEEKGKNYDYDPVVFVTKNLPEYDDKKWVAAKFEVIYNYIDRSMGNATLVAIRTARK